MQIKTNINNYHRKRLKCFKYKINALFGVNFTYLWYIKCTLKLIDYYFTDSYSQLILNDMLSSLVVIIITYIITFNYTVFN